MFKTEKFWRFLLLTTTIGRLISPFFIFKFPLATTAVSIFLDSCDGYLAFRSKWHWEKYHFYDKILDWWWYVFILLYSINLPIFPVILPLFVFRSIGQILTLTSHDRLYLVKFPNILENYFVFYMLALIIPGLSFLFESSYLFIPLVLSTVIAVIREYILHIKKICLSNRILGIKFDWSLNR